jgi:hypothetical protein
MSTYTVCTVPISPKIGPIISAITIHFEGRESGRGIALYFKLSFNPNRGVAPLNQDYKDYKEIIFLEGENEKDFSYNWNNAFGSLNIFGTVQLNEYTGYNEFFLTLAYNMEFTIVAANFDFPIGLFAGNPITGPVLTVPIEQ